MDGVTQGGKETHSSTTEVMDLLEEIERSLVSLQQVRLHSCDSGMNTAGCKHAESSAKQGGTWHFRPLGTLGWAG